MVLPLGSIPQSHGFYAVNNQFLLNGPKGLMELKMSENEDLFLRIDMPGVPKEGIRVEVDPTKKALHVYGEAPKEHKHDSSPRNYKGTTGVLCRCCDISGYISHMSHGVLRLLILKTKITGHISSTKQGRSGDRHGLGIEKFYQTTDPYGPALTGRVLQPNPYVQNGSKMAYEAKQLLNGGLYVRVDMPGVPKGNFSICVKNGRVKVTGQAPAVSHDSGGRFYSGDVATLTTPFNIPIRRIKTIAKNGVLRLVIPPI